MEPTMPTEQRPLVFIYDRCATEIRASLEIRLQVCQEYVTEHGWGFAGRWADSGDQALTVDHRPGFDRLLAAMRASDLATPRVCLIHDWGRFAHSIEGRLHLTCRVLALGGWVETCGGDTRTPDGRQTQRGQITDSPVIV
jgi:hypothetical protein